MDKSNKGNSWWRGKYLLVILLAGIITLLIFAKTPARYKQLAILAFIQDTVEEARAAGSELPTQLSTFSRFPESARNRLSVSPTMQPQKNRLVIIYNSKATDTSSDWIAIVRGRDWETILKGSFVLWGDGNISRVRKPEALVRNEAQVEVWEFK